MNILKTLGQLLKPIAPQAKILIALAAPALAAAAGAKASELILKGADKLTKPRAQ